MRSLLCVKSVGLNIALDPLMTLNLSGCNAGLVLLVGDDPGAWGSQNEQDSRALALAAELPLLEPTSVLDARTAMHHAFRLSEEIGSPVVVRVTRALVLATEAGLAEGEVEATPPPVYERAYMRWVVLPVNVVSYHRRLHQRLEEVRGRFEHSPLNGVQGEGTQGVIAVGAVYRKLVDLLAGRAAPGLRVLRLGAVHPLPEERVRGYLRSVDAVLVLEETAPLVERAVRAVAQEAGLTLPVYGRSSAHVPRTGELFAPQVASALNRLVPGLALPTEGESSRPMPSLKPFCEGCPYVPTFDALMATMEGRGGRDDYIVVGDPGCMVLAQSPPSKLLDVKISLGSSLGIAAGIALGQTGKRVVAISGDSGLLHSGLGGLVDAARMGVRVLVLILDNGTTALSGGQPHPASGTDARGKDRPAVDLAALAKDAGAGTVQAVDLDRGEDVRSAIERVMDSDGVAVVVARGLCPRWSRAG
jgi:indolepyruvate ferredoxin oxidoreductase alpha subunit